MGASSNVSDPLRRGAFPLPSSIPGSCSLFPLSRDHSVLEQASPATPTPLPSAGSGGGGWWWWWWWVVPAPAGRGRGARPGPELRGLGVRLEILAFSKVVGTWEWLCLALLYFLSWGVGQANFRFSRALFPAHPLLGCFTFWESLSSWHSELGGAT